MGFFELIGFVVFFYYIFQIIFWVTLDCDINLYYLSRWGKPISALKGKVVWITGASFGIGRGLAIELAKDGVKLVLSARNVQELEAAKNQCLKSSNGKLDSNDILVLPMDILKLELHQNALDHVISHFGSLDILVNNAGRSQRAEWNKIDTNVDRDLFELDVFSVIHLSRLAVTYFEENNIKGQVSVTSSTAGLLGVPNSASYTGAKHAIHGYFEALKTEKPYIGVNIYCPGPTFSNFLREAFIGTPGQKYNQNVQITDRRMTAERCGQLFAVALANDVVLSWSGLFPVNLVAYLGLYYPNIAQFLLKLGAMRSLKKVRDSK